MHAEARYPVPLEGRPLCGLPPELLLSEAEFFANYATTRSHTVFHVTGFAPAVNILATGEIYKTYYERGVRYGAYAAARLCDQLKSLLASPPRFVDRTAVVLGLKLLTDRPLRILNAALDHPWLALANQRAKEAGEELSDYLAREHGVDVIVPPNESTPSEVVIKNLCAVEKIEVLDFVRPEMLGGADLDEALSPGEPLSEERRVAVRQILDALAKLTAAETP